MSTNPQYSIPTSYLTSNVSKNDVDDENEEIEQDVEYDDELNEDIVEEEEPTTKRQKKATFVAVTGISPADRPDIAGGGSSCHQCKSRRAHSGLSFCSNQLPKKNKATPVLCRKKYCDHCLKKFYSNAPPGNEEAKTWRCPACSGTCSCAACRKKGQKVGTNVLQQNTSNINNNNNTNNNNNNNNVTSINNNNNMLQQNINNNQQQQQQQQQNNQQQNNQPNIPITSNNIVTVNTNPTLQNNQQTIQTMTAQVGGGMPNLQPNLGGANNQSLMSNPLGAAGTLQPPPMQAMPMFISPMYHTNPYFGLNSQMQTLAADTMNQYGHKNTITSPSNATITSSTPLNPTVTIPAAPSSLVSPTPGATSTNTTTHTTFSMLTAMNNVTNQTGKANLSGSKLKDASNAFSTIPPQNVATFSSSAFLTSNHNPLKDVDRHLRGIGSSNESSFVNSPFVNFLNTFPVPMNSLESEQFLNKTYSTSPTPNATTFTDIFSNVSIRNSPLEGPNSPLHHQQTSAATDERLPIANTDLFTAADPAHRSQSVMPQMSLDDDAHSISIGVASGATGPVHPDLSEYISAINGPPRKQLRVHSDDHNTSTSLSALSALASSSNNNNTSAFVLLGLMRQLLTRFNIGQLQSNAISRLSNELESVLETLPNHLEDSLYSTPQYDSLVQHMLPIIQQLHNTKAVYHDNSVLSSVIETMLFDHPANGLTAEALQLLQEIYPPIGKHIYQNSLNLPITNTLLRPQKRSLLHSSNSLYPSGSNIGASKTSTIMEMFHANTSSQHMIGRLSPSFVPKESRSYSFYKDTQENKEKEREREREKDKEKEKEKDREKERDVNTKTETDVMDDLESQKRSTSSLAEQSTSSLGAPIGNEQLSTSVPRTLMSVLSNASNNVIISQSTSTSNIANKIGSDTNTNTTVPSITSKDRHDNIENIFTPIPLYMPSSISKIKLPIATVESQKSQDPSSSILTAMKGKSSSLAGFSPSILSNTMVKDDRGGFSSKFDKFDKLDKNSLHGVFNNSKSFVPSSTVLSSMNASTHPSAHLYNSSLASSSSQQSVMSIASTYCLSSVDMYSFALCHVLSSTPDMKKAFDAVTSRTDISMAAKVEAIAMLLRTASVGPMTMTPDTTITRVVEKIEDSGIGGIKKEENSNNNTSTSTVDAEQDGPLSPSSSSAIPITIINSLSSSTKL